MRIFFSLWLALASFAGSAAESTAVEAPHMTAKLVSSVDAIRAGQPFTVALVLRPEKGWHSYWQNPGDTGLATRIRWTLPEGTTAGPIAWPAPERVVYGDLINFGYHGETILPMLVEPGMVDDRAGLMLQAKASWLVCEEVCVPGSAELSLTLPVSSAAALPVDQRWAEPIEAVLASQPPTESLDAEFEVRGDKLQLAVSMPAKWPAQGVAFFPLTKRVVAYADEPLLALADDGRLLVTATMTDGARLEDATFEALLVQRTGDAITQHRLLAVPASGPLPAADRPLPAAETRAEQPSSAAIPLSRLWLLAFLGGLVLNAMPCVFPVLSLKVLKLVESSELTASRRRALGSAYAAGTVGTFLAIAGTLLALRSAGAEIGWGFQLQAPLFVGLMAYLMFVLGLSLSGIVEIGTSLTRLGNINADDSKLTGSLLTGVLATLVATPCTAPFMGTAVGFAVTQPAPVALSVFASLGLGLASPFLAIAFLPTLAAWLPRPGAWMETLKQFLAFPLYLTAVWLAWVFTRQLGPDAAASLLAGFVAIAFACWLLRLLRARRGGALARGGLIAALTAAGLLVFQASANSAGTPDAAAPAHGAGDVEATPYSDERLAQALAEGRTVFVNFTADWCITCKVNERVALGRASTKAVFEREQVLYLKGDWTNSDPAITRVLERFGRSGVPLYLVYRSGAAEPAILPQVLTPAVVAQAVAAES